MKISRSSSNLPLFETCMCTVRMLASSLSSFLWYLSIKYHDRQEVRLCRIRPFFGELSMDLHGLPDQWSWGILSMEKVTDRHWGDLGTARVTGRRLCWYLGTFDDIPLVGNQGSCCRQIFLRILQVAALVPWTTGTFAHARYGFVSKRYCAAQCQYCTPVGVCQFIGCASSLCGR